MQHDHLFQPLQLRGKQLKNRIVFGAHTANMARDGLPDAQHCKYYEERAIGGAAMIVVEPMPVHRTAVLTRGNFRHDDDGVIEPFRTLVEGCQRHGAVMIQQLYHVGQHGDADLSYQPNWSPSGRPSYHDSDGSHAMSEAEIEEIIEGFRQAARRCQAAGFDGVEVWAAYHSLLDQFWTPWSNHRTDQWGGSLENRMRLSTRIFEAVRDQCGEDFIVGLSFSASEHSTFMLGYQDYAEIVAAHDRAGHIDYVTCGSGNYIDYDRVMPTFVHGEKLTSSLSRLIRSSVDKAVVISESHIRTAENGDYIIASGEADLVSIVRGQIADPQLANKAAEGRDDDIRGCISCNQMCWGRRSRDYWISCLINPSAGREHQWGGDRFTAADQPKQLLVVGGGPAGLECARVAAERGHRVTLCEAAGDLGGAFRLGGLAPRRGQMLDLLRWYERQLQQLGVDLRYHSPLDRDDVIALGADEVVLATGSISDGTGRQRWLPDAELLPGIERGGVWSPEDVMRREARLGERVMIVDEGGAWRGVGTAWHLAEQGHQVIVVTPDPYVARDMSRTTADFPVRQRLMQAGAEFHVESVVTEWHGDAASVRNMLSGEVSRVEASALVMATTTMALNDLEVALRETGHAVHLIGDCNAPRNAAFAFYEGRKLGLEL